MKKVPVINQETEILEDWLMLARSVRSPPVDLETPHLLNSRKQPCKPCAKKTLGWPSPGPVFQRGFLGCFFGAQDRPRGRFAFCIRNWLTWHSTNDATFTLYEFKSAKVYPQHQKTTLDRSLSKSTYKKLVWESSNSKKKYDFENFENNIFFGEKNTMMVPI